MANGENGGRPCIDCSPACVGILKPRPGTVGTAGNAASLSCSWLCVIVETSGLVVAASVISSNAESSLNSEANFSLKSTGLTGMVVPQPSFSAHAHSFSAGRPISTIAPSSSRCKYWAGESVVGSDVPATVFVVHGSTPARLRRR